MNEEELDHPLELMPCPTGGCSMPAEVVTRFQTSGNQGFVSLICVLGHMYSGPESFVTQASER